MCDCLRLLQLSIDRMAAERTAMAAAPRPPAALASFDDEAGSKKRRQRPADIDFINEVSCSAYEVLVSMLVRV